MVIFQELWDNHFYNSTFTDSPPDPWNFETNPNFAIPEQHAAFMQWEQL
jgi:hypothetical protein